MNRKAGSVSLQQQRIRSGRVDPIAPPDRNNFYQRLEPRGNSILHGAGQENLGEYLDYQHALAKDTQPTLYMTYVELKNENIVAWGRDLQRGLDKIGGFVIPQIAINMADVLDGKHHYEADVAAGVYDKKILQLVQVLAALKRPVFLRIGDEFNGFWMGYDPAEFILAYQRIARFIRGHFLQEVALVWNFSVDSIDFDYMSFYPGDCYVDWWAVNLFSKEAIELPMTRQFVNDAQTHRRPIMIGESTPRHLGVTGGGRSWNGWFVPYFNFVRSHPNIKAFSYISTDWSKYGGVDSLFNTWGDSRIQNNAYVLERYQAELYEPCYLHRIDERRMRSILGLSSGAESR